MHDKSSLIGQLRIDRSAVPAPERRLWPWIAGGAAVAVIVVVGAVFAFSGSGGVPVKSAMARAIQSTGPATGGGSLLDASGYVIARRTATVSSKQIGRVAEVLVEEGQHVEADQVVARLDDSNVRAAVLETRAQVQQAQASLMAATVALENAKPNYDRYQAAHDRGAVPGPGISMKDYENAKTAYDSARTNLEVAKGGLELARAGLKVQEQNLTDMTLRSPFAGVVTVKSAQPGEMISPAATGGSAGARTGVCTIVDMDSLEVQVDVSENFISRVHAHQPTTIHLNAYPDWNIPGEVIAVIPTADKAKATVQVRVAFKEKDERVIPDMGARVSFLEDAPPPAATASAEPRPVGVVIPSDAVQGTGDTATVYVITKTTVHKRTVRLGARNADGQTVLSGLNAGEQVAVGDLTQLSDGAKVLIQ